MTSKERAILVELNKGRKIRVDEYGARSWADGKDGPTLEHSLLWRMSGILIEPDQNDKTLETITVTGQMLLMDYRNRGMKL